jgi:hypothetical protein
MMKRPLSLSAVQAAINAALDRTPVFMNDSEGATP